MSSRHAPGRGAEATGVAAGEVRQRLAGQRLVDRISQQLQDLILELRIAPGTVLLQTEWAEKLEVSRTPLREAFRILEQDGLVAVSNGNRTVRVVDVSGTELRDLLEVRGVIDGLAARLLACRGMSVEVEQGLVAYLAALEAATDPFDPPAWFAAHLRFHLLVAESCGNKRVRRQSGLLKITSFALHSHLTNPPVPSDELARFLGLALRHHRTIYDALRSGNGDLAEMAAHHYIRAMSRFGFVERSGSVEPLRAG